MSPNRCKSLKHLKMDFWLVQCRLESMESWINWKQTRGTSIWVCESHPLRAQIHLVSRAPSQGPCGAKSYPKLPLNSALPGTVRKSALLNCLAYCTELALSDVTPAFAGPKHISKVYRLRHHTMEVCKHTPCADRASHEMQLEVRKAKTIVENNLKMVLRLKRCNQL